jgi:hypothetical protein
MKRVNRWVILGLTAAVGQLAGCGGGPKPAGKPVSVAQIEQVPGTEVSRVTLTDSAMKRIDVQTDAVSEKRSSRSKTPQKCIPYAALLYDMKGKTWVYTNPKANTFVRAEVEVDFIEGDTAYLTKGPDVETKVAKVGVAELYGTETKFGHY